MGKKPKSKSGKEKANSRKVDKSTLPPPPAPVDAEVRRAASQPIIRSCGSARCSFGMEKLF